MPVWIGNMGQAMERRDLEIAECVRRLADRRERRRSAASAALRGAGTAAVGQLLGALRDESARSRRTRPLKAAYAATAAVLYGLWLANPFQTAYWALIPVLTALLTLTVRLAAASSLQIEAAALLADSSDVRAVGPLAEALEYRHLVLSTDTATRATRGLVRLLPRLSARDARAVTPAQWRSLYRVLEVTPCASVDLSLAILEALERLGGLRALSLVGRLGSGCALTYDQTRIRAAAAAASAVIRRRIEIEGAPRSLLRPAQSGDADKVLLHPASGPGNTQTKELLRLAAGEE
jgi:hypothetical protein